MRKRPTWPTPGWAGARRGIAAALTLCAAAAAALALTLTACGGDTPAAAPTANPAGAPEQARVTLIMDWVPWVLDIPVGVAQEKGYYADAGLQVRQILPAGATDVVKFVSTGKAQFGLYYAPDILMGVGEGAPLVSVAGIMDHAPVGLAMKPGSRASAPRDLVGKVVGIPMVPSTRASFASLLAAGGVKESQVKVADPGFNLVAPLLSGTYDAVAFTEFGELVEAEQKGQKLSYLDFRDWGTPDYAFLNIVTSSRFAQANPATTRAFTRATLEGLTYAVEHPQEAVDIYTQRHPELKKDLLLAQWKAAIPSLATATSTPAGWQDTAAWGRLNDWLVHAGLLDRPVNVGDVVSNEYLGEK